MTKALTVKQTLKSDAFMQAIGNTLPKHVSPDRMAQIYIAAITKTPLLAKCDQASLFKCLMSLSAWGLEPDGYHVHLIPFQNRKRGVVECQLILDYKGIVELVYRSGKISSIHADVVRDGDLFDYSCGKVLQHRPHFLLKEVDEAIADPAKIVAAYCVVEFKDGASKTELMSRQDVEGIRKRSKASGNGPWVTDFAEMAKKTVFKRAAKWLPISAEVVDAFNADFDRRESLRQKPSESMSADAFDALVAGGDAEAEVSDSSPEA